MSTAANKNRKKIMNDLGKSLLDNIDNIIETWVEEVRRDIDIESSQGLTYEAVHNGLPDVLESVATLLTAAFSDEDEELEDGALEHGSVRAAQGFDIAEIVREYRILRNVLLTALEPALQTGSVTQVIKAIRQIDDVLDEVALVSLESYVEQRLRLLQQMHGQLLLTNQELTRLVQLQKDNVSHLAHELKNPLNSIIGFSSILLRKQQKELTAETAGSMEMKQIERILNNGRQLLRLINNTAEVAEKESEVVTLKPTPVQVNELIKTVLEAFEPTAQEKALELYMDCDRAPKQVTTDTLRLQQILTNLVSNAIRYSDDGNITVTSYTTADQTWAIAVKDTGRGISAEDQPKIFEPYFRVDDSDTFVPESSGLGLAIVSKLVRLLQGNIELTSAVGEGSTFTVFLPLTLKQIEN